MYDPAKVAAAFSKLFQTYPAFQAGEGGDDALRVYFEAVEPYNTGDILDAVQNFITGSAPGVNPNFAPPAPALASECRRVMNLRLDHDRIMRKPALPPPQIEHTPEARERIMAMAKAATERLTAPTTAEERTKAAERRERADAEIRARVASGEMLEMPGSSFPVSQTLAKQLGYEIDREDRDVA